MFRSVSSVGGRLVFLEVARTTNVAYGFISRLHERNLRDGGCMKEMKLARGLVIV